MIEEDRETLRAVAWSELFPWLILFRCFRLSIGVRALLVATVAAVATVSGWWLIESAFSGNEEIGQRLEGRGSCPWTSLASVAGPDSSSLGFFAVSAGKSNGSLVSRPGYAMLGTWAHLSRPFIEAISLNLGSSDRSSRPKRVTAYRVTTPPFPTTFAQTPPPPSPYSTSPQSIPPGYSSPDASGTDLTPPSISESSEDSADDPPAPPAYFTPPTGDQLGYSYPPAPRIPSIPESPAGSADAPPPLEPVESSFQASKMAYSLLCGLWALGIWAFAGAALTRDAALQLTTGELAGTGDMIRHARGRWRAYAWAPLLPYLGILITMFVMALGGVLMKLNLGVLVAGILWPAVLLAGFLMTLLAVGLLFGWPLMFATISVEGTDSFDALSRAYSYVYQRPLQLLLYTVVATLLGAAGWLFVSYFALSVLSLTQGAVCWGSGGEFRWDGEPIPRLVYVFSGGESTAHLGWVGNVLIRFWTDGIRLLAVGYLYSYFWVASTAVYLLLRRGVDDTDMDDVYIEEPETGDLALPEITLDPAGAPVVEEPQDLDETE